MSLERAGYFKSLNRLSRETVDQLLATLRQRHLRIEPIPSEVLSRSSLGPKVTEELTRLPIYLARGVRSWNGLVVCFPGNRKELTTAFVGTPYLRRILYPMLDLYRRLQSTAAKDLQCIYILGERFPDVMLRKFRLLDQVIPHVIVLTGDIYKSMKGAALPPIPKIKNEAWVQAMLCREMAVPHGLAVPLRDGQTRLGFIAPELPTGEGTKHPERLDILAYDKSDHSLVAVEIKGPKASRVEIENLFLQGLEHRNWLEYNKMAVKLMTLSVQSDDNGNGIISTGKGTIELVPLYLPEAARKDLLDKIIKLSTWGDTALKEKVEIDKHWGSISSAAGAFDGPSILGITFHSGKNGELWLGEFDFCKIHSSFEMTAATIGKTCKKEVKLFLPQSSIVNPINFLEKIQDYSKKAVESKSKSDHYN